MCGYTSIRRIDLHRGSQAFLRSGLRGKRHVHETQALGVHCSWFSELVFESGWDWAAFFAVFASAAERQRSTSPTVIFESGLIVRFGPRMKNHRPKRDQKSSPLSASNSLRNSTMLLDGTSCPSSLNLRPPKASANSGTHDGKGKSRSTATSHTRAVLSLDAVTIRRPSGLKLAARTTPSWRIGSPTDSPLSASHSRAVLSSEAVTIRRPSGLKLAAVTLSWWSI